MRRFLLIATLILAACSTQQSSSGSIVTLRDASGAPHYVQVELAITPEERSKGLMHRTELPDDHGMLFIFEEERPLSFWMKNTLIPLDILYFRANGAYVSMATMTPCEDDPCPSYRSKGPAKYALEVPAQYAKLKGIGNGWSIELAQ